MFDLLDRPRVWIPVYWPGLKPAEKEGEVARVVEHRLDLLVEILDREPLVDLFGMKEGAEAADEMVIFKRIVSDWRRIVASGEPVPFNDDNIRKVLSLSGFPVAFQAAYFSACAGKVETREGN